MAKRKAARAAGRKGAARSRVAKTSARKTARAGARKTGRKATSRAAAATKAKSARKTARKTARAATTRKTVKKNVARKSASSSTARKPVRAARAGATGTRKSSSPPARKAPALDRERRRVQDEDIVFATPPSSLNLDRSASAARSGRRELRERYNEHTETSPALTGGDVDADWESAYSVGDEAPGGDNPTPDQDIVDDIGRAVGVEYQDNEELKSENKLIERDKHRWELDPASSEDYDERD